MPEAFDAKERDKRLMAQLAHMRKTLGKDAVRALTEEYSPTACHSTGVMLIDKVLNGGVPKGRITETYGKEGGGKTTLAMSVGVQAQKAGGIIFFNDVEHKFDESMLKFLGGDRSAFIHAMPENAERAWMDMILWAEKAGPEDIGIMDSIAALTPKEEAESYKETDEQRAARMGSRAKLNRNGLHAMMPFLSKSGATFIAINQLRTKMGIAYGNPEYTPGGDDLKYQSSLRLRIVAGPSVKQGEKVVGHICRIHSTKSGHCAPFQKIEVPLVYGKGFEADNVEFLFDMLVEKKLVVREAPRSANYIYGDNQLVRGKANFIQLLKDNEQLRNWFLEALTKVDTVPPEERDEADAPPNGE